MIAKFSSPGGRGIHNQGVGSPESLEAQGSPSRAAFLLVLPPALQYERPVDNLMLDALANINQSVLGLSVILIDERSVADVYSRHADDVAVSFCFPSEAGAKSASIATSYRNEQRRRRRRCAVRSRDPQSQELGLVQILEHAIHRDGSGRLRRQLAGRKSHDAVGSGSACSGTSAEQALSSRRGTALLI